MAASLAAEWLRERPDLDVKTLDACLGVSLDDFPIRLTSKATGCHQNAVPGLRRMECAVMPDCSACEV